MRTKAELLKHLEEDAKVLGNYEDNVIIKDDGNGSTVSLTISFEGDPPFSKTYKYVYCPPKGNLCLCWRTGGGKCKDIMLSLGDGSFAGDTEDFNGGDGCYYDHWKDLGINVLDKLEESCED